MEAWAPLNPLEDWLGVSGDLRVEEERAGGPEERGRVAGSSKEEGAGGLGSQKTDLGLESSVVKGRKAWRSGLMFSQKRGAKGGTSPSWTTGNQGADS